MLLNISRDYKTAFIIKATIISKYASCFSTFLNAPRPSLKLFYFEFVDQCWGRYHLKRSLNNLAERQREREKDTESKTALIRIAKMNRDKSKQRLCIYEIRTRGRSEPPCTNVAAEYCHARSYYQCAARTSVHGPLTHPHARGSQVRKCSFLDTATSSRSSM